MINIKDFDSSLLKIDKKLNENIGILKKKKLYGPFLMDGVQLPQG